MVLMDNMTVCIRWISFVLNSLIWIGGTAMLGLAIWVSAKDTEYKHITGDLAATIGSLSISSFIFIVGFLGTCALLLMKPCLLKTYFSLLLLLVFAEITIAVYLFIERDKIESYVQSNWNNAEDATRILIQTKMSCCSMKPVILSHASSNHKSCFTNMDTANTRLTNCYTKLNEWIQENYIVLASVAVIVAFIEVFILGSSCRLLSKTETHDRLVRQVKVSPEPSNSMTQSHQDSNHSNATTKRLPRTNSKGATHEADEELILEDARIPRSGRKEWAKEVHRYKTSRK